MVLTSHISHLTYSARQTFLLGKKTAKNVLKSRSSAPWAWVVGLSGDLGSGKTVFAKGFAAGLGIKEIVTSPTFFLMRRYPFSNGVLYHVDPYRLEDPSFALRSLGFFDTLNEEGAIIIIEWAERIRELLPRDGMWIELRHRKGDEREIVIKEKVKMQKSKIKGKS